MDFTVTVVVTLIFILALAKAKQVPPFAGFFESSLKDHPSKNKVERRAASAQFKWIEQKLDHFSELNTTWYMSYAENNAFFKDGGPIFIYLGGGNPVVSKQIKHGIIPDLAKQHNGILFLIEHRYYGRNRPTSDLSVDNMKYLTAKQALADLAHFIRIQRETDHRLTKSKVIIAGCSYAGSLAIWFSKLYPDLVDGVFASSAPVLTKVDCKEYNEVVGQALQEFGTQQCYDRIRNGIKQLEEDMLAGTRQLVDRDKKILNLCSNFDHDNFLDVWTLFAEIANTYAYIVQYQAATKVPMLCNNLMSFPNDLDAIAAVYLDDSEEPNCVDATYNKTLNHFNNTNYTWLSSRPWFYQCCNEFGFFPSSTSKNQPFGSGFPIALNLKLCYDVFGDKYTAKKIYDLVDETNKFFGGKNSYPTMKNIYITGGSLDPWRSLFYDKSQGVSVIPKASHCADLGSISDDDSPEVRASKNRLVKLVSQWLA